MNIAELIDAAVARLGAVSAITDSLGTVPDGYQTHAIYTNVPQSTQGEDLAPFPFLSVTPVAASSFDTKSTNGVEASFDVHVWYRGHTLAVPLGIGDAIYDALHRYDLPVTGANVVNCLFDGGVEMMDPDGITMHVVRTFKVTYFLT